MITVVGSLNLDFFIETPHLPSPGETVLGRRFRQSPGGKGANQAAAAARLSRPGAATHLIGCVGADAFGHEMLSHLKTFGVSTQGIITRHQTASGVAFIAVDDAGRNQIIVSSGANATLTPADIADHAALIQGARVMVVQLEIPLPTVEAALREARAAGVVTLLNPAPAATLPDELLALCDWIIPNELEAAVLAGEVCRMPGDAPAIAAAVRRRAPRAGVLITLGAAGAWLDQGAIAQPIPPFPVEAVDTVGAGDTFVGAFAVRLAEGAAACEAAAFASVAAGLAVTRRGAQDSVPTRAETDRRLPLPIVTEPAE